MLFFFQASLCSLPQSGLCYSLSQGSTQITDRQLLAIDRDQDMGLGFEHPEKHCYCLPGMPRHMQKQFHEAKHCCFKGENCSRESPLYLIFHLPS